MLKYITLVTCIARALWSLEATTASPSDAFVFWLAIAHVLDDIFKKPEKMTGISSKLAGHVRAVFNARYGQFFKHSEIYFVAFCLDRRRRSLYLSFSESAINIYFFPPGYPNSQFLRKRFDAPLEPVDSQISFPHAFIRVKEFLKNMLRSLISEHEKHDSEMCHCHPILKTRSAAQLSSELKTQLDAFWLEEAAFNVPVKNDDIMEYWLMLEAANSPRSGVLAVEFGFRVQGTLVKHILDACCQNL